MKQQDSLSPSELREEFEKARDGARADFSEDNAKILKYLSEAVSALQAQGADIRLIARANGHSNAFDMMYTVSGGGGGTVEAHGFLVMGETSHLWAIASKHNSNEVSRLYISKNNVLDEGGRISTDGGRSYSLTVIPGACYDFREDADALKKMQRRLIQLAAGNEILFENDPGNVFNKDRPPMETLKKPVPKFKL